MMTIVYNDQKVVCRITKSEVVEDLIREYRENCDSVMGEMLNSTQIHGASVQDVVDIFASTMAIIEDDIVIQVVEGVNVVRGVED